MSRFGSKKLKYIFFKTQARTIGGNFFFLAAIKRCAKQSSSSWSETEMKKNKSLKYKTLEKHRFF